MKIFFDVDGVLIDGWHSRPEHRRPWDATIEQDLGLNALAFRETFFGAALSGGALFEACALGERDLKEALAEALPGVGYTGSVQAFIRYWFEHDSNVNSEVMAAVKVLAGYEDIELYLATGQEHHRAAYLWDELALNKHFKDMFYSARLGLSKNTPEFFLEVNRRLGIASTERPLLFDDSERVVESAREAGWDGVVFNTPADLVSHPRLVDLL